MKLIYQLFFFFLGVLIPPICSMTQQYTGTVTAVSPDGRLVAIVDYTPTTTLEAAPDPMTIVYDTYTKKRLLTVYGQVTSFSPDSIMLCTISSENKIRIYENATGRLLQEFFGMYAKFISNILLIGLTPTEGEVYGINDWELLHKLSMTLTERTTDSLMSPFASSTGKLLAQVTKEQLMAYDISTGYTIWHGPGIDGSFSDDGSKIGIDCRPGKYPTVDIYVLTTGQRLCRITGSSTLFSPDNCRVATTKYIDQENKTTIYDATTGLPQHTYSGELLQFSPDGTKAVIYIEGDGKYTHDSIRMCDLSSDRTIQEFDGETTDVAFLPNGRLCIQKEGTTDVRSC